MVRKQIECCHKGRQRPPVLLRIKTLLWATVCCATEISGA